MRNKIAVATMLGTATSGEFTVATTALPASAAVASPGMVDDTTFLEQVQSSMSTEATYSLVNEATHDVVMQ